MESSAIQRRACKKCGIGKLDTRARRGMLVKATLFWLPIKRYRCNACDKKTYVLGSSFEAKPTRQLQIQ